jgi:hypothetical protein
VPNLSTSVTASTTVTHIGALLPLSVPMCSNLGQDPVWIVRIQTRRTTGPWMRDELRRLYEAAGTPPKSALKSHADAAGHHVAESTLIGLISPTAKGHPRRATVEAFVDACASYADKRQRPLSDQDRDKLRWLALLENIQPVAPPDDGFDAYLERLRERFGRVDTETLLPLTDQDEPVPIPLPEIFVPQRVRPEPPPVELPRGLLRRLQDAGDIDPDELPTDFDHERLDRAREAYRQRPARPVLEVLAEPAGRLAVILGDPGSGKSALARYLALAAADEQTLPLLIELRAYAADPTETFLHLLDRRHTQDGLGLPRDVLEKHLRGGGPALVVFDGLDEIFDARAREEVTSRITGFAARYPSARVLVTSRVFGYRRAPFDAAGFTHHMLQDLDDRQVAAFAERWYRTAYPHDPAEADRRARRLLDGISAARAVRELAGNPLLLTILAIIARRAELPRDRRTAYEHAVTVLVEHWEVNKSLAATDAHLPRLDRHSKLELLRLIARHMQDTEAGLAGNHVSGKTLTEQFRRYLVDEFGLAPGPAGVAARSMLDQFRRRNFILSHFGGEVYGFVHRAFLEYLAAADIVTRFDDRELSEEGLFAVFDRHWRDPAWHEVLLLVTGMKESFAGRIVDFLLSRDPEWFHRRDEPRHALLALRCLGEVRKIGRLTAQSEAVADVLGRLLEAANRRVRDRFGDLELTIERVALPVLRTLGPGWAGRHRIRDWYLTRGRFLNEMNAAEHSHSVVSTAARLAAVVLADDPEFRELLRTQAATAQPSASRAGAIQGLVTAWRDDEDVRETLTERAALDLSPYVRQAAALALLDAGAVGLVSELARADPSPSVRKSLGRALAFATRYATAVRDLLVDLAGADPAGAVRSTALRYLATHWRDDPSVRSFVLTAATGDRQRSVRRWAIRSATATWPDRPEIRPLLDELIESADAGDRRVALTSLARHLPASPGLAPLLERHLQADPDALVRQAALNLLADRDAAGLPLVLEAAGDAPIATTAMQLLAGRWRDDPRTPARLEELTRPDAPEETRQAAVGHLANGWIRRPGVAALLRQLAAEDGSDLVRSRALGGLAAAHPGDPEVLALLHRGMADGGSRTRRLALGELAAGWPAEPDTFEVLTECGDLDMETAVRTVAVRAVADGLPDHPAAGRWLCSVAENDASSRVRAAALASLVPTFLASPEVVELFHRMARTEKDIRARRVALAVVGDVWHDAPGTLPMMHELAGDDIGWVRSLAVRALAVGWHDHPDTGPLLRRLAETDPVTAVRRAADDSSAGCYVIDAAQNRTGGQGGGVE